MVEFIMDTINKAVVQIYIYQRICRLFLVTLKELSFTVMWVSVTEVYRLFVIIIMYSVHIF